MPKVKVLLDEYGRIEKYRFPHYMNTQTFTNPFNLVHMVGVQEDCEVIGFSGAHLRDSLVDARGNVADELPAEDHVDDDAQRTRLFIGYGNIFGVGFEVRHIQEPPRQARHLCHIGSGCMVGAGVVLNSNKGFRIQDECIIEDGSSLLGSLQMDDQSIIATGVYLSSNGRLEMALGSFVGEKTRIIGSIHLGDGASLGKKVDVPQKVYIEVPASAEIPAGHRFTDEYEDLGRFA